MRSVQRSPEPGFLAELRAGHTQWDDLDGHDRQRIRDALVQDFGPICAYCQQTCQPTQPRTQTEEISPPPNEESIDHFRPRSRFPALRLDWSNLIYACYRCNQNKGDSWPGYDDALIDQVLTAGYSRYTPVSEYVSPNSVAGQRPAREFFSFNVRTGEVTPAEELGQEEWSIALRTIRDINLNDSELGENDPTHLCNRRLYQLYLLQQGLDSLEDFDSKVRMMFEFMLPDKPFSGFISAYLTGRFPLLGQLFQQY